jgi:hypothetical protein
MVNSQTVLDLQGINSEQRANTEFLTIILIVCYDTKFRGLLELCMKKIWL